MDTKDARHTDKSKIVKEAIIILENHPAAFVVLGILCFLVASQGIELSIGDYQVNLLSPSNKFLQAIFLFMGITLFFCGCLIIIQNWKINSKLPTGALVLFLIAAYSFAGYSYLWPENPDPPYPIEGYTYDIKNSTFYVTLAADKLAGYRGMDMVCAIRREDASMPSRSDTEIDLSHPFNIPEGGGSFRIETKAIRISKLIDLGDRVECHIFAVPHETSLEKIKTIADFDSMGGLPVRTCKCMVVLLRNDPENLKFAYERLGENRKATFRKIIGIQ